MRTLLALLLLLIGSASAVAQSRDPINNPQADPNAPAPTEPTETPPSGGVDPDSMTPAIVGVVCTVAILFAVCYPFRTDE